MPAKDGQESIQLMDARFQQSLEYAQHTLHDSWVKVWSAYHMASPKPKEYLEEQTRVVDAAGRYISGDSERGESSIELEYTEMPDIWSYIRRLVARAAANPPVLTFKSKNRDRAIAVSSTLMYQWDKGQIQRVRKRRLQQASIFGWDMCSWSWQNRSSMRTYMVRLDSASDQDLKAIRSQYAPQLKEFFGLPQETPDSALERINAQQPDEMRRGMEYLANQYGVNGRLRAKEYVREYAGPRCDFLTVMDCYPQPGNATLEECKWSGVKRMRGAGWFNQLVNTYNGDQDLKKAVAEVLDMKSGERGANILRERLAAAHNHRGSELSFILDSGTGEDAQWEVKEMWTKGENGAPAMVEFAVGNIYLGKFESPVYLCGGKIPFTDMVLVDSLMDLYGDALGVRLVPLHNNYTKHVNARNRLVYAMERPYAVTADDNFFAKPQLMKRAHGLRLLKVSSLSDLKLSQEGAAATASVVASLQNEESIHRAFMMATGLSNASNNARLDPLEVATATGARIRKAAQDELAADFTASLDLALAREVEMMREMNLSELDDEISFDSGPYASRYQRLLGKKDGSPQEGAWITVQPEDFRDEGTLQVVPGSSAPDDTNDQREIGFALFDYSLKAPNVLNPKRAAEFLLVTLGQGGQLDEWIAKEQEPVPPPVPMPEPPRVNLSLTAKLNELPPDLAERVLRPASHWMDGVVQVREIAMHDMLGPQKEAPPDDGQGDPTIGMEPGDLPLQFQE